MLNSPRIIVRATVVALSAAIVTGSAFAAQAAESTPEQTEVHKPSTVATEAVAAKKAPSTDSAKPVARAAANAAAPVAKTVVKAGDSAQDPKPHKNMREARSKGADDMNGPAASVYTGKFYNEKAENFRQCIVQRESNNHYSVTGGGNLDGKGGGDYQGAYQLSPALAEGATWMMAKESKEVGDGLYDEVRALQKVPANEWPRYWQDRAFWTILNWDGDYSGAKHWAGGRWTCSQGMQDFKPSVADQ